MAKEIVLRLIPAGMLLWASANLPYGYFNFMKFMVCGVAVYLSFQSYSQDKEKWTWMFWWVIAVLFNPIFPIHLDRGLWKVIDIIVAIVFIVSIFRIKLQIKKSNP